MRNWQISVITAVGVALLSGDAIAQDKPVKEQLVGTWRFASSINTRPDGTKFDPNGGVSKGVLMFDSISNFSTI